jgi:hypothetical protein
MYALSSNFLYVDSPHTFLFSKADEYNFKKTKALFELHLLPDNDPLYPPEARVASGATWMLLNMLRVRPKECYHFLKMLVRTDSLSTRLNSPPSLLRIKFDNNSLAPSLLHLQLQN